MCAKSFCSYGLSSEDLISEGTLGLIKAIEKFDYTKGFRLITYAKAWIRLFMQEAVNLTFLNAPSELDFSHPVERGLPNGFFDKNVLLISKGWPCLSWFERTCIIPLRKGGKPVPRYISVQPKILTFSPGILKKKSETTEER